MTAKVTSAGLLIPGEMLDGATEVELLKQGNTIVVTLPQTEDPILGLGESPVRCGVNDGSVSHDKYLHANEV